MIILIGLLFVWDVMWFFLKACFIILWNLTIWPIKLIFRKV